MPRIIPGKPLSDHTKIDYNECYAKLVIEKVFPNRYSGLLFSDKPDLRNTENTIGIEVTSAIPKNIKESTKLWMRLENNTAKYPEKNKERMKQLGVEYTNGIQVWPATVYPTGNFDKSPFIEILKAFEDKVAKLNSGNYALLDRYDLYIETELFVVEDFMPIILDRVLKINSGKLQYSYLYVIFHNRICEFDLVNKTYEIRLMLFEQYDLAMKAREIVERAEKMTNLDQLIEQLCPDGVEYKTIGEIAVNIYRGSGIKRNEVTADGIPCVRYGEIYTSYNIWFDSCISHTKLEYVKSPKYFEHGDILFAITGESVEEIAKSIAYIGHEKCLAGGDIVVLKHNQNPKYLSYALSTVDAQKQKSAGKVKSKVVHSSVPAIKAITIPIPPIEVQAEIVRILDKFTELTTELTTELANRKKQYEYYQYSLLNNVDNTIRKKLGELVEFRNGKGHEKSIVAEGKYIVVNSKFISTNGSVKKYSNNQICPLYIDEILMVMSDLPNGRALAKCFLVEKNETYTLNQRIGAFHVKSNEIITKFLFYVLNRNSQLLRYDNGVDQTNLRKDDILNIHIPVPPIEEQQRIVAILDRFDALCNDISEGLPAEIETRQKQYEYYRDKLLTFKEVGTSET